MSSLFTLKASTLAILLVASFVSALCQANHAFTTYEHQEHGKRGAVGAAYEVAVAVLLVIGMLFIHASYEYIDGFCLRVWSWNASLVPVLWLNALGAAAALFMSVYLRRPLIACDVFALLCLFPPIMEVVGPIVPLCLYVAWFFARSLYVTWWDAGVRHLKPGRHLVNDALKGLPEGIMLAQANGRVLLVNDAMRRLLALLDWPLRLSDANEFWQALMKISEETPDEGLRLKSAQGRTIVFYRREPASDQQDYWQYWAFDVTESIGLSREIGQANDQLAAAADRMEEQLGNVEEIAQREAVLTMQARMHDVASQRLSILHGMLQSGKVDDASLAELKPLLSSIIDDLANEQSASADALGGVAPEADASGIQPLQHAFSLIGTRIELSGSLPDDSSVRAALFQVIREASTNAVRHAHATEVRVALSDSAANGPVRMEITNDGKPATSLSEGNGIRGMRRRIERLAGTVDITCLSPFTLCVEIPCGGVRAFEELGKNAPDADHSRKGHVE